jgi:hypothetical protein
MKCITDWPGEPLILTGNGRGAENTSYMISVMRIKECPKIEYHVAKVIEHQYGVGMDTCPRKEDIRVVLKQRHVRNYGKLIENLEIEEIEKHFPQLIHALRAVEGIVDCI